jgi:hypothetical protein
MVYEKSQALASIWEKPTLGSDTIANNLLHGWLIGGFIGGRAL